MRIGGRLRGSTCVLRPDLGGHSNHHHPDYWIFRLVGAAILRLRFSASMETGPLSDTWGALWVPSPSICGLSLLTCSSTQPSSAVCFWCMQGIEPDTDPINDYQLLSDVKASSAPSCNCVMSSTNALLPFTVTRSVTSREISICS